MDYLRPLLSILAVAIVPMGAHGQVAQSDSTAHRDSTAQRDTTVSNRNRLQSDTSVVANSKEMADADSVEDESGPRESSSGTCSEQSDRFTGKRTVVCRGGTLKHDDSNVKQEVSGPKLTLLKSPEREGFLIEVVAGATSTVFKDAGQAYFLVDGKRKQVPVETRVWRKQDRVRGRVREYVVEEVRLVLGEEISDRIEHATEVTARIGGVVLTMNDLSSQVREARTLVGK